MSSTVHGRLLLPGNRAPWLPAPPLARRAESTRPPKEQVGRGPGHAGAGSQQGSVPGGPATMAPDLSRAHSLQQVCSPGNPAAQLPRGLQRRGVVAGRASSTHPHLLTLLPPASRFLGRALRTALMGKRRNNPKLPRVSPLGKRQVPLSQHNLSSDGAK